MKILCNSYFFIKIKPKYPFFCFTFAAEMRQNG